MGIDGTSWYSLTGARVLQHGSAWTLPDGTTIDVTSDELEDDDSGFMAELGTTTDDPQIALVYVVRDEASGLDPEKFRLRLALYDMRSGESRGPQTIRESSEALPVSGIVGSTTTNLLVSYADPWAYGYSEVYDTQTGQRLQTIKAGAYQPWNDTSKPFELAVLNFGGNNNAKVFRVSTRTWVDTISEGIGTSDLSYARGTLSIEADKPRRYRYDGLTVPLPLRQGIYDPATNTTLINRYPGHYGELDVVDAEGHIRWTLAAEKAARLQFDVKDYIDGTIYAQTTDQTLKVDVTSQETTQITSDDLPRTVVAGWVIFTEAAVRWTHQP